MPVVTCEPSGRRVVVAPGTRLLEAVRAAGLPVGMSCDGEGICGKCGLLLLRGSLSPATADERRVAAANGLPAEARLSCQARVTGDVAVRATYW